jgi:hypothetical protein
MLNIYLLGHGFILQGEANKFCLSTELYTYVRDNTMLDGRGLENLIQNGQYIVADDATQIVHHKVGELLQEHLLCSDMSTMNDINKTQKWKDRDSHAFMEFKNGWGKLTKLTSDTYIYVTTYGTLTRLSDIQVQIDSAFNPESHSLHWAACRTFVDGETDEEIIEACTSSLSEPTSLKHR